MASGIKANVRVSELRRAWNFGKAQGVALAAEMQGGPTYDGVKIDIIFRRAMVVDYRDPATGKILAIFQDLASIDD